MAEEMSLAVFDPIKSQLAELTEKDANLVFDHTTPAGEKELRSYVARLRGYKGDIKRAHETGKRGALDFGRKVDAIKNELTTGVQKIIDVRMKPLDEIEAAKRAEAEAQIEAERVEAERAETERLADLKRREAEVARREAEQKAAEDAANAEQREADRIVREKRIAESAAQTAREEAEEKAKAATEKAERERVAAVAAAHAEQHRLDDIERNRVADEDHRKEVEEAAKNAIWIVLEEYTGSSNLEICETLLIEIQNGRIPHVTINY